MKKMFISAAFAAIVMLGGCCCYCSGNSKTVAEAKDMIRNNKAECIVVKDGKIAAVERGRGVSPLLKIYDTNSAVMRDSVIVDKVIGRAAAFIVVKSGAKSVYGKIMSEDAKELLAKHKITASHDLLVPRILNRKRDGLCPLEASVSGIDDPDAALNSMRKRIAEMRRGK